MMTVANMQLFLITDEDVERLERWAHDKNGGGWQHSAYRILKGRQSDEAAELLEIANSIALLAPYESSIESLKELHATLERKRMEAMKKGGGE